MVEFDPNEVLKYRPFDLTQFRQGAPVTIRRPQSDKQTIRILCTDRVGAKPIVALITTPSNNHNEVIMDYFVDGCVSECQHTHWAELVMAPIGNVDGTDVYYGDKVYHKTSGTMNTISKTWPGVAAAQILRDYLMQPPTVSWNGRDLGYDSQIWYKKDEEAGWKLVKARELWTTSPRGHIMDPTHYTHYGMIKANVDRPHLIENYAWDFPVKVRIEGRDLNIGETVWYKHSPSDVGVEVTALLIEGIAKGTFKASIITRRPWFKRELWQAEVQVELGDNVDSDPILIGPFYNSETECAVKAPLELHKNYVFRAAKVVSSYYV